MNQRKTHEIWHLSLPALLMLFFQAMVGLVDVWAAGRLGMGPQAALGLVSQLQTVLLVVATAAAGGAASLVGHALRENRMTDARRFAGLILSGGILCALVIAAFGFSGRTGMLEGIATPAEVMPAALTLLSVYLWALPGQYTVTLGGEIFRAVGESRAPLVVAGGMMLLNVFGDLAFGLGYWGFPAYGMVGIAWSTLVSVYLGMLVLLALLARARLLTRESLVPRDWRRENLPTLLRVTIPAAVSSLFINIGNLLLFFIVAMLPGATAAMAGLSVGLKAETFFYLPAALINAATTVLVKNRLAKRDRKGARQTAARILVWGGLSMTAIAAIFWPFRGDIAAFLSPEAAEQAALFLTFQLMSVPFTMISYIASSVFAGAGANHFTLLIYDAGIWLARLPLSWWLGLQRGMGARGVFMALLIASVLQAVPMLILLLRDSWSKYALNTETGPRSRPEAQPPKKKKTNR